MIKLECVVDILNRGAHAIGTDSLMRGLEGSRTYLQIRKSPTGISEVVLFSSTKSTTSVAHNLTSKQYEVKNISKIRTDFPASSETKLILELSNPMINLIVKNCNQEDLNQFLQELRLCRIMTPLACTVEILNRAAHAIGAKSKSLIKGTKMYLQIRRTKDVNSLLVLSTTASTSQKNPGKEYEIKYISKIRSDNISDGLLTIELMYPMISLFIKNCNEEKLAEFFQELKSCKEAIRSSIASKKQEQDISLSKSKISKENTSTPGPSTATAGPSTSTELGPSMKRIKTNDGNEISVVKQTIEMPHLEEEKHNVMRKSGFIEMPHLEEEKHNVMRKSGFMLKNTAKDHSMVKLGCVVDIFSRSAHAAGSDSLTKEEVGSRTYLQVKSIEGNSYIVLFSSTKSPTSTSRTRTITCKKYEVKNISKIRTNFPASNETKLILELSNPMINLIVKNCNQEDLNQFLQELRSCKIMTPLVCTVDILNRAAHAVGAKSLIKGAKTYLQIRRSNDGNSHLVLSTAASTSQNVAGKQYEIKYISNIRSNFISEGKLTIELVQPMVSLFIKNCNSEKLVEFFEDLKSCKNSTRSSLASKKQEQDVSLSKSKISKENTSTPGPSTATAGPSTSIELGPSMKRIKTNDGNEIPIVKETVEIPLSEEEKRNVLRKSGFLSKTNSKDHLIPQLNKMETKRMKKALRENTRVLNVTKRENYPLKEGFSPGLMEIALTGISLKKIDPRLAKLQCLTQLDLSDNNISSIEDLKNLAIPLEILVLSNNRIESLSEGLVASNAFNSLTVLHLNQNKINKLPLAILENENLRNLQLAENNLVSLPYNMHKLKNLKVLILSKNKLKYLPATVKFLKLQKLDISGNPLAASQQVKETVPPVNFEIGQVPTLMSIAAEALMTYNSKCKPPNKKVPIIPNEVPIIVRDHLNHCVYCIRCGGMALNYSLKFSEFSLGSEELISESGYGSVSSKMAYCTRCTFDGIYKF